MWCVTCVLLLLWQLQHKSWFWRCCKHSLPTHRSSRKPCRKVCNNHPQNQAFCSRICLTKKLAENMIQKPSNLRLLSHRCWEKLKRKPDSWFVTTLQVTSWHPGGHTELRDYAVVVASSPGLRREPGDEATMVAPCHVWNPSRLPSHFSQELWDKIWNRKAWGYADNSETHLLVSLLAQVHWSTCSTCSATRRTRLSGRRRLHCLQRWSQTNWLDLKYELCSPSSSLLSSWTPWETVLRPAYTCLRVSPSS